MTPAPHALVGRALPMLAGAAAGAGANTPAETATGAGVDAITDVATLFTRVEVDKGTPLLVQGGLWQHAFLLERAAIRLYFLRRDGREFNKNFYTDGALICPLTPAMWGEPSLFGISSLEPGVLWRADASAFRQVMGRHGAWAAFQAGALAGLVTLKLQREHDLLALDGRRRYQAFCERHPQLAARIPLVQLASYLGLTDVSLSRIRRELNIR